MDTFSFLRVCGTDACWMSAMLEAKLKFTSVPFLCIGDVYIKEEMQDPCMLSSALQMSLKLLTLFQARLSLEENL